MGIVEIIGGALLLVCGIGIIILTLFQESPKGGAVSSLGGADSYYNKNQGRTREAMMLKLTKYFGIAFFVITLAVYAIEVYL